MAHYKDPPWVAEIKEDRDRWKAIAGEALPLVVDLWKKGYFPSNGIMGLAARIDTLEAHYEEAKRND